MKNLISQNIMATINTELKHDPVRMIMACHYTADKSINADLYVILDKILESLEILTKISTKKLLNKSMISPSAYETKQALQLYCSTFLLLNICLVLFVNNFLMNNERRINSFEGQ